LVSHLENADTMGERIERIGQIETDFFWFFFFKIRALESKNPIRPIRSIRSPIVSAFSKAETAVG
jgi:hypothetical protein